MHVLLITNLPQYTSAYTRVASIRSRSQRTTAGAEWQGTKWYGARCYTKDSEMIPARNNRKDVTFEAPHSRRDSVAAVLPVRPRWQDEIRMSAAGTGRPAANGIRLVPVPGEASGSPGR